MSMSGTFSGSIANGTNQSSDEDTTDWRAPPESLVDEAALLRKIV